MRSQLWLNQRLEQIWELLFPEVPKLNTVKIKFKGKFKNKFGHIESERKNTLIIINELFRHDLVPEFIIDLTIAHELIHYMHGFNSPLPKQFKYPHKGNIVERELLKRGFGHLIRKEKDFVKKEWPSLYHHLSAKTI